MVAQRCAGVGAFVLAGSWRIESDPKTEERVPARWLAGGGWEEARTAAAAVADDEACVGR